jgi:predicted polyphosphate/ATP-dependent NAD kinase
VTDRPSLGLIVNPIAGMGGRVGLKGTDGPDAVDRALELGATPLSQDRASIALAVIASNLGTDFRLITAPRAMGEQVAREAGFEPIVVGRSDTDRTTASDTRRLASDIVDHGVDLLLFAGGDGTARDICSIVGTHHPALGIPTGVKMHSAVYATTPTAAGELATELLSGAKVPLREAEVMDIDEEAFRSGRLSARLYGSLHVPYRKHLVQGLKSGGSKAGSDLTGIAADIAGRMTDNALWILGPGTTTQAIGQHLGLSKTLLGVDLVYRRELVASDATEREILRHLDGIDARIVVTPIGGQGYLFGRGNQQLSPDVIRRVGTGNILVVSASEKLAALQGDPLLVDTGDRDLDAALSGYLRVITGYHQEVVYRVA